jgi:multiple sugar transport system ATP-binding protein
MACAAQVGTPRDLYANPKNVFVAGFIGSPAMNLFTADLVDGGPCRTSAAALDRATMGKTDNTKVTIGVRPEDVRVSTSGEGLQVAVSTSSKSFGATATLRSHRHRWLARRHRRLRRRPLAPERW